MFFTNITGTKKFYFANKNLVNLTNINSEQESVYNFCILNKHIPTKQIHSTVIIFINKWGHIHIMT